MKLILNQRKTRKKKMIQTSKWKKGHLADIDGGGFTFWKGISFSSSSVWLSMAFMNLATDSRTKSVEKSDKDSMCGSSSSVSGSSELKWTEK